MADETDDLATSVQTDGGVSLFTSEPFVTVRSPVKSWQWTCEEARAFAVLLIRTAAAAEADADILAEMRAADMPENVMGAFVSAIRNRRNERP